MKQKKLTRDMAIAMLLVGLFLLILALVSLDSMDAYLFSSNPLTQNDLLDDPVDTDKPIEIINKHLREVYDRQEIQKKNAENLNVITAPPIYKSPKSETVYDFENLPISFDQDSINELIGKDLGHMAFSKPSNRSLSEQIQHEVVEDITKKAQQEAEKRSLADAIINKAREKGFQVEVDDNYKIKSIKKINKTKEGPSLFDPNAVPNR